MSRRQQQLILAALGAAAVVAAAFFIFRSWRAEAKNLPVDFIEARKEGARTAERIVFFSHQALAGLEQIGQYDEKKNYESALELVEKELERNKQARQEAIVLSSYLGTMAAFLPQIEPAKARELATEAVGYEVSLVNRLINYHDLLNQLFELLGNKFRGRLASNDDLTKKLLASINSEIKAINNLNQKFNSTMEMFDKILKAVDN